jgi:hypothetical protein
MHGKPKGLYVAAILYIALQISIFLFGMVVVDNSAVLIRLACTISVGMAAMLSFILAALLGQEMEK